MRKRLKPVSGGYAVIIDRSTMDLLQIAPGAEMEVMTDGRRLILSPVDDHSRGSVAVSGLNATAPRAADPDFRDPAVTVRLIEELQRPPYNMMPRHFSALHHFEEKASVATHLEYSRQRATFRRGRNEVVARRLLACLRARQAGKGWEDAIQAARAAHPMPRNDN